LSSSTPHHLLPLTLILISSLQLASSCNTFRDTQPPLHLITDQHISTIVTHIQHVSEMNTPPTTEPPVDDPPAALASPDFGPKKRSRSFGGLKPLMNRSSDGNKSDSGSITGSGSGGGKVKGFFAQFGSKKKSSDNSLSTGKTATSSSVDEDGPVVPDKSPGSPVNKLHYPSRHQSDPKLPTIPQSQPGSEIMKKSTSSRTEGGKGTLTTADPFRLAVTEAEAVIDKLQSAYTVLSALAQIASVAQELLPGVGAAIGIVANMLKSAKTVAVNKVAALRLVSWCHHSD